METITQIDFNILNYIQSLHNKVLDCIMQVITTSGDNGYIWIATTILLLAFPKTRKIGVYVAIALAAETVLNEGIIKNIIERERPFIQNTVMDTIIKQPSGYSFPSSHSASSFAAATTIFMKNKKLGRPAYAYAALIAFSRVYFYVHFPSDVIVGALFGSGIGAGTTVLLDKIIKKSKEKNKNKTV